MSFFLYFWVPLSSCILCSIEKIMMSDLQLSLCWKKRYHACEVKTVKGAKQRQKEMHRKSAKINQNHPQLQRVKVKFMIFRKIRY